MYKLEGISDKRVFGIRVFQGCLLLFASAMFSGCGTPTKTGMLDKSFLPKDGEPLTAKGYDALKAAADSKYTLKDDKWFLPFFLDESEEITSQSGDVINYTKSNDFYIPFLLLSGEATVTRYKKGSEFPIGSYQLKKSFLTTKSKNCGEMPIIRREAGVPLLMTFNTATDKDTGKKPWGFDLLDNSISFQRNDHKAKGWSLTLLWIFEWKDLIYE